MTDDSRPISFGGAIKALGDGKVGGYLVPFTSPDNPDLHGEYFDAQTDLMLDDYPLDNLRVLYHHGLDKSLGVKRIGRVVSYKLDDAGVWVEAQLEMRDEYERAIYELAQAGKLGWSSGALPQSVRTDGAHIKSWAIIEGSLTPTPAMPQKTQITTLKALDLEPSAEEDKSADDVPATDETKSYEEEEITTKENAKMDMEKLNMLKELVDALLAEGGMAMAGEDEMKEATEAGMVEPNVRTAKAVVKMIKGARPAAVAPTAQKSSDPEPSVKQSAPAYIPNYRAKARVNRLDPKDAAFLVHVTDEVERLSGRPQISRELRNEALKAVADDLVKGVEAGRLDVEEGVYRKALNVRTMKANELDHTTNTNFGAEWIPTTWGNQLWEKARAENLVLPTLQTFNMTSKTQYLPVESGDPTVYYVAESTDETNMNPSGSAIPDSKIGTAQKLFTAQKLAIRTAWSAEEDEDSIIAYAQNASRQSDVAFREKIDALLLNGDTATGANTNINQIDGTPTTGDYYLAINGLLKYPLVTATTNAVNSASYVDFIDGVKATIQTLGRDFMQKRDRMVFFCDPETHYKLAALPEYLTMDAFGDRATLLTGQVGVLLGVPVVVTPRMELANTAGKISATPANNTKGRLALVYRDYWYVGMRRNVTSYVARSMDGESYQLTMTTRMDMQQHSSADASSVLYNITV